MVDSEDEPDQSTPPLTPQVLAPEPHTGRIIRNDAAVDYFTGAESGPAAELARKAFEWRYEPPRSDNPEVLECIKRG